MDLVSKFVRLIEEGVKIVSELKRREDIDEKYLK